MTTTRWATTTQGSWCCWAVLYSSNLLGFNLGILEWCMVAKARLEPLENGNLLVGRVLFMFLLPTAFHVKLLQASHTTDALMGSCCWWWWCCCCCGCCCCCCCWCCCCALLLSRAHLFVAQKSSNRWCFNYFFRHDICSVFWAAPCKNTGILRSFQHIARSMFSTQKARTTL